MLSEVMASEKFKNSHSPLTVAFGVNLAGDAYSVDDFDKSLMVLISEWRNRIQVKSVFIKFLF